VFPKRAGTTSVAIALAAAFQSAGCEWIAGVDDYALEATSEPDTKWRCLDVSSDFQIPAQTKITIRAQTFGASPIPGAIVKFCRNVDLGCKEPLLSADATTDENGNATADITRPFAGYVSVEKPFDPDLGTDDQYVPAYYYLNFSALTDPAAVIPIQVVTVGLRKQLIESGLQSQHWEDRGIILLHGLTCDTTPAAGLAFTLDEADDVTDVWYERGGVPRKDLKVTQRGGYGGFINVPSQLVTVRATVLATNREVNNMAMFVRPNAITYGRLMPQAGQNL
jgi:hypothetical protein